MDRFGVFEIILKLRLKSFMFENNKIHGLFYILIVKGCKIYTWMKIDHIITRHGIVFQF